MKKTKTGVKRKRQKTDRMKFSILSRRLKKNKMYEMSPDEVLKFMIEFGMIPPDSKRIPETFDQISFKRKIKGLTLVVHTSFNPTLIGNNPKKKANGLYAKKGGAFWILILDENRKRIFTRKRYRTATAINRIPDEVKLIIDSMKNRPKFHEVFIYLDATIKVIKNETFWVSPSGEDKRLPFFKKYKDDSLNKLAKKLEGQRMYYRKVVRFRNGIKKTENKKRIPWKTK